jgi:4-amino-4-deoxy-L-arabinose transferase-like glycosyltransferase
MKKIFKNKFFWLAGVILFIGIFLRIYHWTDTIFFEIDQARDYKLIDKVLVNGINEFPLVGPKAGGTSFRLGSLFYILPLISSWIFGLSIISITLPDLIFSILTIPIFYFFLREFFSLKMSAGLTLLFSTSLFAIEYAHFIWNPNSIPFFTLLSFYALLKISYPKQNNQFLNTIVSRQTKRKNNFQIKILTFFNSILDNKLFWTIILALSTAILMQLHAITLIGIPIILVSYLFLAKVKVSWKQVLIFCSLILLLFLPLILNDILTQGENGKEFARAIIDRNSSDERATAGKKIFINNYNFIQFYSNILLSQNFISRPIRVESSKNLSNLLEKNFSAPILRHNLFRAGLILIGLISLLFYFFFYYLRAKKNNQWVNKFSIQQHNFILLIVIWQITYFCLFYSLSLSVDSRYFLVVLFIPFILLGFILNILKKVYLPYGRWLAIFLLIILIMINFWQSMKWINSVNNYSQKETEIDEFILEPYFLITSQQWEKIIQQINKMIKLSKQSNIYIHAEPYHIRSLSYLLKTKQNRLVNRINFDNLDQSGIYFLLRESSKVNSNRELPNNFEKYFDVKSMMDFGTVVLFQLELKNKDDYPTQDSLKNKEKYPISKNRCYQLELEIDKKAKCSLQDIPQIWK